LRRTAHSNTQHAAAAGVRRHTTCHTAGTRPTAPAQDSGGTGAGQQRHRHRRTAARVTHGGTLDTRHTCCTCTFAMPCAPHSAGKRSSRPSTPTPPRPAAGARRARRRGGGRRRWRRGVGGLGGGAAPQSWPRTPRYGGRRRRSRSSALSTVRVFLSRCTFPSSSRMASASRRSSARVPPAEQGGASDTSSMPRCSISAGNRPATSRLPQQCAQHQ
jgi:hypothetical protein